MKKSYGCKSCGTVAAFCWLFCLFTLAPSLNGAASLAGGSVQCLISNTGVEIMGSLCQVAAAVTARLFSMCAGIQSVLHWLQDGFLHF